MRSVFFLAFAFHQLVFAEGTKPLVIRVVFSGSATQETSAPPIYERLVAPEEVERWKKSLVHQLFDSNVRQALTSPGEKAALPTLDPTPEGIAGFLGKLKAFASERGWPVELGLLDALSLTSLRNQHTAKGPFEVDFTIPREPFRLAIKEILYSAGYVEGLDDIFAAVAKAKAKSGAKIGLAGVIKKAAGIRVAVGAFRQASAFLETGTLESLEKQEWMERIVPEVDKYLDEDLDMWARLFCVSTSAQ